MLAVVIAEGVAIVLLGVLVLGLLRSHALILKALHELGAGLELEKRGRHRRHARRPPGASPDPCRSSSSRASSRRPARTRPPPTTSSAPTSTASSSTVTVTTPGTRTLLAFLTSGCSVCQTFWDEFQGPVDVPGDGALRSSPRGPAEESISSLRALAGDRDVVQSSGAWVDYDIPGSPYFVYVEGGVVTGEGSATTWAQVRDLMAQGVADSDEARAAAGRTGPGLLVGDGAGPRVSATACPGWTPSCSPPGSRPGDPSLYRAPDAEPAVDADHDGHDHHDGHVHHEHHDHPSHGH